MVRSDCSWDIPASPRAVRWACKWFARFSLNGPFQQEDSGFASASSKRSFEIRIYDFQTPLYWYRQMQNKTYIIKLFTEKGSLAIIREIDAMNISEAFRAFFLLCGYRKGETFAISEQ
jgi:hypothetical protein